MAEVDRVSGSRDGKVATLVAAIDLEQSNKVVLDTARQLSAAYGAELVLVHVADAADIPDARVGIESRLRGAIGELIREAGFERDPRVLIEFGPAHRLVTTSARDLDADLLVIGPGRPASAGERVFGSTADRIVRTSPVPVLVAKTRSPKPYRHVAVAADFSEHSERTLRAVIRLAPTARVELVHAVDISRQFEQMMLRSGPVGGNLQQFRAAKTADARKRLAGMAQTLSLPGKKRISVLQGSPASTLIRLSRSGRVDLLALGTQGRNAVAQALLGSVSRRVLAEASCDVLVTGGHSAID